MTNNDLAKEAEQAREMARLVIKHHFGSRPRRIRHLTSGQSNYVFAVKHPEGDFVVRLSFDPTRLNLFIKEQWAQTKASEAGVPTTEILEVGNDIIGHPFMIARTVEGHDAAFHPNRTEILRQMGRFAALINSIKTEGFGGTFDWSSNQLSHNETWKDFLEKELDFENRLNTLEKQKMLSAKQIKKLHTILKNAGKKAGKPSLNHGDVRLKNVIVSDEGEIKAMIDWEHCTSNLAPHWELSLALHDLSVDEKQIFLEGYGLPVKKLIEIAPVIKAINFINYAPEIERLAELKDTAQLEHYRARLGGAFDFYSLTE